MAYSVFEGLDSLRLEGMIKSFVKPVTLRDNPVIRDSQNNNMQNISHDSHGHVLTPGKAGTLFFIHCKLKLGSLSGYTSGKGGGGWEGGCNPPPKRHLLKFARN